MPKRHRSRFEDTTPGEFASLARMLKDILQRMNATLLTPPYNLIVHSAPLQDEAGANEFYHWHVEVMPKLTRVAGLRVGDRVLHQSDGTRRSGGGAAEDENLKAAWRVEREARACDLALSPIACGTLTGCRAGITQW